MSPRLAALLAVIASFGAFTAFVLLEVGFMGIFRPHFQAWGPAQVFLDLVILAVLACIWMVDDGRRRGIRAWPFVVVTLLAGSFGPLLYLVARELQGRGAPARSGRS